MTREERIFKYVAKCGYSHKDAAKEVDKEIAFEDRDMHWYDLLVKKQRLAAQNH